MHHFKTIINLFFVILFLGSCNSEELTKLPEIKLTTPDGKLGVEVTPTQEIKYDLSIDGKSITELAAYLEWSERDSLGKDKKIIKHLAVEGFQFPITQKDSVKSFLAKKSHQFDFKILGNTTRVTLVVSAKSKVGHQTKVKRKIKLKTYLIRGKFKLTSLTKNAVDSTSFVKFSGSLSSGHTLYKYKDAISSDFGYLYDPVNYKATLFSPDWDKLNGFVVDPTNRWTSTKSTFFAQVTGKQEENFDKINNVSDLEKYYPLNISTVKEKFMSNLQLGASDVLVVLLENGKKGFLRIKRGIRGGADGYAEIEYIVEKDAS